MVERADVTPAGRLLRCDAVGERFERQSPWLLSVRLLRAHARAYNRSNTVTSQPHIPLKCSEHGTGAQGSASPVRLARLKSSSKRAAALAGVVENDVLWRQLDFRIIQLAAIGNQRRLSYLPRERSFGQVKTSNILVLERGYTMRLIQKSALTALALVMVASTSQANAQGLRGIRVEGQVGYSQFHADGLKDSHLGYGAAAGVDFDLGGFIVGGEGTFWWAPAEVEGIDGAGTVQHKTFEEWGLALRAGVMASPSTLVYGKLGLVRNEQRKLLRAVRRRVGRQRSPGSWLLRELQGQWLAVGRGRRADDRQQHLRQGRRPLLRLQEEGECSDGWQPHDHRSCLVSVCSSAHRWSQLRSSRLLSSSTRRRRRLLRRRPARTVR